MSLYKRNDSPNSWVKITTKADAYSKALGLPIEGRPRSTTTS